MKKTSTLLILVILAINTINLFSQDRVSKSVPTIGTQIKGQLTKSTGWLLNPESQWVSRPNKIPSFIENKYKTLIDYRYDGLGFDNFISYQMRDVKIQDITYSILIKKYKDGYYKYPSIEEGWTNYNSVIYYVLNKDELHKLAEVVNDSINLIRLNVLYSNNITWIENETYISDIQKEIVKQIGEKKSDKKTEDYRILLGYTPLELVLHIAPYKKKNIVQFQIYDVMHTDVIGGIIKEHKVKDDIDNDGDSWERKIYLSEDLFKYCYYEVDYLTFNNFIKITK